MRLKIRRILLSLGLGTSLLALSACQLTPVHEQAPATQTVAAPVETATPVAAAEPLSLWSLPDQPSEFCEQPYDLWSRIRNGYALEHSLHPRVETELKWFASHPEYLERVAERASPYLHLIVEELEERQIPMEIALLPIVESAFQPFAYSHGRAAGIWQFIPGTGRRYGLKQTWWYDGRRDIAASTEAALKYLSYLNKLFDGDWMLALAAYNSGEGTVGRAIRRNKKRGQPTDFWSLDLPKETRGYVPKLLAIARLVENPPAYGVILPSIADEAFLTRVDVGSQIDLDLAAELAGISLEAIYRYNPAFNRWASDPNGPHELLVPLENSAQLSAKLQEYPPEKRIAWTRHRIRSGENLGTLAAQYKTTVSLLKKINKIRGNMIRAGQSLIIPVARKDLKRYKLSSEQRLARLKNRDRDGTRVEYHVQEGDTLWEIAQKFSVGVNRLAKWNGMAPRDTLRPGQKLVIWTQKPDEQLSSFNPSNFTHPFQDTTRRRIGYTVRKGDSLAAISRKFKVSVSNVKRWNDLNGNRYLQPGQRLTLYVDVTRQGSGNI